MVNQLIELFKSNICTSSTENFLAVGGSVGLGLFSFADYKRDPSVGLYLTYRVWAMPIVGYTPEFYLGIYETPPDYDDVFLNGVYDTINLDGNQEGFGLTIGTKRFGFFTRKTSRVAKDLFKELQNNPH